MSKYRLVEISFLFFATSFVSVWTWTWKVSKHHLLTSPSCTLCIEIIEYFVFIEKHVTNVHATELRAAIIAVVQEFTVAVCYLYVNGRACILWLETLLLMSSITADLDKWTHAIMHSVTGTLIKFDNNAWILPNFSVKQTVKITATASSIHS